MRDVGDREFATGQQAKEYPSRAHRHIADFFEQEQDDSVDQVDDCRGADIHRVDLAFHNLLNLAAARGEDVALDGHKQDRAENDVAERKGHMRFVTSDCDRSRQVNEDVRQILHQPL